MRIRVLLAEDHESVRHGLRLLIESQPDMEVVGEASDGRVAAAQVDAMNPNVLLLDVSMPELNGLQTTRLLRSKKKELAILALTRHHDDAYVKALVDAGASGYVLKQSSTDELLRAIRTVASGQRYIDSGLTQPGSEGRQASASQRKVPQATDREREVLRRMALGYSNKQIATAMDISVKTVEVHKANAMRKLELRGRLDVVRFASLQGWLRDP